MARDLSVPMYILEKDYAISHLLVGISSIKALQDKLVFKGGTALKKYYYALASTAWEPRLSNPLVCLEGFHWNQHFLTLS